MISPVIIELAGDVNDLQDKVRDLEAKVREQHELIEIQQGRIELMILRGDMMAAHVENLIERVADLEGGGARRVSVPTPVDTSVSPSEKEYRFAMTYGYFPAGSVPEAHPMSYESACKVIERFKQRFPHLSTPLTGRLSERDPKEQQVPPA